MAQRQLFLGAALPLDGKSGSRYYLPADHLCTHGCIVGMTGSGKSGYLFVLAESALLAGIPTLMIDVKGDLPNLLLNFQELNARTLAPWVDSEGLTPEASAELAESAARQHLENLGKWGISADTLSGFARQTEVRVITPGSTLGEPLHLLSSFERRSALWDTDADQAANGLSAAVSLVLRLVGRNGDPAKSREHVLLCVLAKRRHLARQSAALEALLEDLVTPPLERVGAQALEDFVDASERRALAAALNTLLAAPSFAHWRTGASLDVGEWLCPKDQRTPAVVVSVAHLDEEERSLVLSILFEELLAYTRSLSGTKRLRALVMIDECVGMLPPRPANPPTKRPLVALMKQGRAFGIGLLVATQNPMDLDYRALSNAGFWAIGRLQTDADRERIVEGLVNVNEAGCSQQELDACIRKLAQRWFLTRNVYQTPALALVQPRWALSYLKGPMTLADIRRARGP